VSLFERTAKFIGFHRLGKGTRRRSWRRDYLGHCLRCWAAAGKEHFLPFCLCCTPRLIWWCCFGVGRTRALSTTQNDSLVFYMPLNLCN